MIKQLKRKFIFTAMIGISIILVTLLGTINVINIHTIYNGIDEVLLLLSENVDKKLCVFDDEDDDFTIGSFLEDPKSDLDTILSSNFFVVQFDGNGSPIYVNTNQITSLTDKDAISLASRVRTHKKDIGEYGKYQFHISTIGTIQTIVFLDISEEIVSYLRILLLSCSIGLICWGLMLAMVIALSNWAIAPVAESFEKQKQFITNAGHELKTPIAAIQTNVEALELFTGQTKWSSNIKNQSLHLTELVQSLLTLARMDENTFLVIAEIPVSEILQDQLDAFQTAIEGKGISLYCELDKDIWVRADKGQIENLISILIDNAVSYTEPSGSIWVRLDGKKQHFSLQIENTCEELPDVPPEKLFERFYRADKSHKHSDGKCGIGLSIADAIVASQKGSIEAKYLPDHRIRFTVKI